MKQLAISLTAFAAITFTTCNNGSNLSSVQKDTSIIDKLDKMDTGRAVTMPTGNATFVHASFTNVNADVAADVQEVASRYFHMKHALVNDDAAATKKGASMVLQVVSQFDNATFPAEQKSVYDSQIGAIKEHAQTIVTNDDLDAERMHFAELSKHMYELIKAFGVAKRLYYDHCPMALNNKGANWLNESLGIQNPYFKGTAMNTCGKVEKVIE